MKISLNYSFVYYDSPEDEQEQTVIDLLKNFADFCDSTDFEFQCIPRIGEAIIVEDLVQKWIEREQYKNPNLDSSVWRRIYKGFNTGSFKVAEIYHSLDVCKIHCSDIEYKDTE